MVERWALLKGSGFDTSRKSQGGGGGGQPPLVDGPWKICGCQAGHFRRMRVRVPSYFGGALVFCACSNPKPAGEATVCIFQTDRY